MTEVHAITENEIDLVCYYKEFKDWYSGLSAPARRTLSKLPREVRLSIARTAVEHRLIHGIVQSIPIAPAKVHDQRPLIAA